jgi:hypothetical protein
MANQIGSLLAIDGLEELPPSFHTALWKAAKLHGYDPSAIAAVMKHESDFEPAAMNPNGHALGSIQFWDSLFPPIAARAGQPSVQWRDLAHMSLTEQLPFVMSYFDGTPLHGRNPNTPADYALATFMPAFIGRDPAAPLGVKGSTDFLAGTSLRLGTVYDQNAGLDANHDGVITVGDATAHVAKLYSDALSRSPIPVFDDAPSTWPIPAPAKGGSELASIALLFFCPYCGKHSRAEVPMQGVE